MAYVALALGEKTAFSTGGSMSNVMPCSARSEPPAGPVHGRAVSAATFLGPAVIVEPFSLSAVAGLYSKSASVSPSCTVCENCSVLVVSLSSYATSVALRSGPSARYGVPAVVLTLARSVLNETSTRTDLPADSTLALIALPASSGFETAVTFLTAGRTNSSYTTNLLLALIAARRLSESKPTPTTVPMPPNTSTGLSLARPVGTPSSVVFSRNTWTRWLALSATAKRRPSLLNAASMGRLNCPSALPFVSTGPTLNTSS